MIARRRSGASRAWLQPILAIILARFIAAPIGLFGQAACAFGIVVLLKPWWLVRWVAVPAGLVRLSSILGWLAGDLWDGDRAGGRLLAGAWALLRSTQTARAAALEALAQRSGPLGAAGLVGAGFLAARRGDRVRARLLLESIDFLPSGVIPGETDRLAVTWRLADALAGARWSAAELLGLRLGGLGRLIALAAARLDGRGAGDSRLERAWRWNAWRAPELRPLIERALVQRASAPTVASVEPRTADPLRQHVALIAAAAPTLDDFRAVAAAWDASGAVPADADADLAALALAAGVALPEEGEGVLLAAHQRARRQLLDDVESACRVLQARAGAGRDLPPLLEWHELLALRAAHERAARLGGLSVRRLLFPELHAAVCPLACRLWNERRQHVIAGATFRWLFDEAVTVGDARLAEHERKNLGATR